MRVKCLLALAVLLSGVSEVRGQEISDTQAFPGVARLAGAPPSQWVSDVVVSNPNDHQIEIGLQFLPERTTHTLFDLTFDYRETLAPGETRLFEDVLGTVFGYTTDIKGVLIVTCSDEFLMSSSNGEDARIVATMRTYDVSSPVGTYGQTIPSNGEVTAFTGSPSYLTGARNDSRFRSNLGLINVSFTNEVTIHYRFRRADSQIIQEGSKTLGSLSMRQWSFNALGVGAVEGPIMVELWLDSDDVSPDPCVEFPFANAFVAYVSKVDSDTQDGEFIYAAPSEIPYCD